MGVGVLLTIKPPAKTLKQSKHQSLLLPQRTTSGRRILDDGQGTFIRGRVFRLGRLFSFCLPLEPDSLSLHATPAPSARIPRRIPQVAKTTQHALRRVTAGGFDANALARASCKEERNPVAEVKLLMNSCRGRYGCHSESPLDPPDARMASSFLLLDQLKSPPPVFGPSSTSQSPANCGLLGLDGWSSASWRCLPRSKRPRGG